MLQQLSAGSCYVFCCHRETKFLMSGNEWKHFFTTEMGRITCQAVTETQCHIRKWKTQQDILNLSSCVWAKCIKPATLLITLRNTELIVYYSYEAALGEFLYKLDATLWITLEKNIEFCYHLVWHTAKICSHRMKWACIESDACSLLTMTVVYSWHLSLPGGQLGSELKGESVL